MTEVSESALDGFRVLTIENAALRFSTLPELGAKGISLLAKRTGREYLWRDTARAYRTRNYDDPYRSYNYSGWDECFPSISPLYYPEEPWRGIRIPDHGELWCLPWRADATPQSLHLWTDGVRFPYRFERHLEFIGDETLRCGYTVTNRAPYPFSCSWSVHPLLVVKPSNRLLLPGQPAVRVELSLNGRLGPYLTEHRWPITRDTTGSAMDLRAISATAPGVMDKLYTSELDAGWAAIYDIETTEYLLFQFPREVVPFVGFLALSALPTWTESWFIFALEPCSGWPDRLDVAVERGACWTLPALGTIGWYLDVTVGLGRAALGERVGSGALTIG